MTKIELVAKSVRGRAGICSSRGTLVKAGTDTASARIIGDPSEFVFRMERELDRMRRHCDSSGLLLIGPDGPLDVQAMDLVGARFANSLRSYDALCRYGANRLLVLLPHVVESHVYGIVRRLRIQMTGYSLRLADGTEQYVTSVIGATMLDPAASLDENIERVVKAHRAANSKGGNAEILRTPPLSSACGVAAD